MAKGIYVGADSELPNLVVNGDFSNGITGWNNAHSDYCTMEAVNDNGEKALKVTITKSITTAVPYQTISSINETDIFYFCGYGRGDVNNVDTSGSNYISICLTSTTPSFVETNSEYVFTSKRSTITNASANTFQRLQLYNRGENAVGNVYYWKDIKCYNLTAAYGAGNEPTKEWCDETVAKYGKLIKTNISHKVKKAYIGVDSKARKVKKGYIGVGGVAQLFYSTETLVPFTSNRAPKTWTDSSDGLSATATNSYGEWRVEASTVTSTTRKTSCAFDNAADTYWASAELTSNSDYAWCAIYLPTGVSINPTNIDVKYGYVNSAIVQGLNEATGAWESIANIGTYHSDAYDTAISPNTTGYYTAFRVYTKRYSSSNSKPRIHKFYITSGTLRIS